MNNSPTSYSTLTDASPQIFADRVSNPPALIADGRYHQWTISLTMSGQCNWQGDHEKLTVSPGDLLIVRERTWFRWKVSSTPWDVVYCVFYPRPHWMPWLDSLEYRGGFALVQPEPALSNEIAGGMLAVTSTYDSGSIVRDDETLHALELVLLKLHAGTVRQSRFSDPHIQHAIIVIQSRYSEALTVPDIAAAVGLSSSRLAAKFSKFMRMAPGQYLEAVRLARAAQELHFNPCAIGELALAVGYADPSYFARRFRLRYGLGPNEYREANRSSIESSRAAGDFESSEST